jgi:hypothetical protein
MAAAHPLTAARRGKKEPAPQDRLIQEERLPRFR